MLGYRTQCCAWPLGSCFIAEDSGHILTFYCCWGWRICCSRVYICPRRGSPDPGADGVSASLINLTAIALDAPLFSSNSQITLRMNSRSLPWPIAINWWLITCSFLIFFGLRALFHLMSWSCLRYTDLRIVEGIKLAIIEVEVPVTPVSMIFRVVVGVNMGIVYISWEVGVLDAAGYCLAMRKCILCLGWNGYSWVILNLCSLYTFTGPYCFARTSILKWPPKAIISATNSIKRLLRWLIELLMWISDGTTAVLWLLQHHTALINWFIHRWWVFIPVW